MPTVGLIIKENHPAALASARQLAQYLCEKDVRVRARATLADQLNSSGNTWACEAAADETSLAASDFVVVLGGDGTLLGAARLLAPSGTPILPVHLGRFGFITEVAPEKMLPAVEAALSKNCRVEERLMLSGIVHPLGEDMESEPSVLLAMNDIVVASSAVRMVRVRARIGDELLATYAADGVIVASPTGSTGYSLSAGGPLVHPSAPALIVTPICPHTLSARSLIIPDTETIHLTVEGEARDMAVASVDGQIEIPLLPGDTVSVSRSPHRVRLLSTDGPSFYQKIRDRWYYASRSPG